MPKHWDRVSLEVNTRPIRVERDIRREDLLAPAYAGFDLGAWLVGSVLVGALLSAAVLFVWEIRSRRDFAAEL